MNVSKHRYIFFDMKSAVESFLNSEKKFFYKKMFSYYKIQLKAILDEKFRKQVEVSQHYANQIKEIELMFDYGIIKFIRR